MRTPGRLQAGCRVSLPPGRSEFTAERRERTREALLRCDGADRTYERIARAQRGFRRRAAHESRANAVGNRYPRAD